MGKFLGIDLGTSNSSISVVEAIPNENIDVMERLRTLPIYQFDEDKNILKDKLTLPSVVYFDFNKTDKLAYTGVYAKSIYASGNKALECVKSIKTRIGGEAIVKVPYSDNEYNTEALDISETSALLLKTIKSSTEQQLECNIDSAVVTVPAAFNNDEREAVINAMKIAGFENIDILDEPTAVLLYDVNKNSNDIFRNKSSENYIIYDIGGGTLDVTIANIKYANKVEIDILARSPRRDFGGDDFDKLLAAYMLVDFEDTKEKMDQKDEKEQHMMIARLISEAEKCKININNKIKTKTRGSIYERVKFEVLNKYRVDLRFSKQMIEKLFESLVVDPISDLLVPIKESLEFAKLSKCDIGTVILTGGSSDFFVVEKAIKKFFDDDISIKYILDEAAVSKGAAIYNYHLNGGISGVSLDMEDKMADDIYLKDGDDFRLIIPRTKIAGSRGSFDIEIKFDEQSDIELFTYYGTSNEPESYVPIQGRYMNLTLPMKKGDKVKVEWEMDKDKIVKFSINELNENLTLKRLNSYTKEKINSSIVNEIIINDSI